MTQIDFEVRQFSKLGFHGVKTPVVRELPLTIYLNGEELVTVLASPEHLEELVAGYLLSEGIISHSHDIKTLDVHIDQQRAQVVTREPIPKGKTSLKPLVASGGAKGSLNYGTPSLASLPESGLRVDAQNIIRLMSNFLQCSTSYHETRGIHGAALSDGETILIFREDIGRHNALDKVFGWSLLNGVETKDRVVLTTGRISSEIALKVARRGATMLLTKAVPTDLGILVANQCGMTLVGRVNDGGFTVYSHGFRVRP